MKKFKIILGIILTLCILLSITVYAVEDIESKSPYEASIDGLAQAEIERICKNVAPSAFGGIYLKDESTIVVNIIEQEYEQKKYIPEEKNGIKIIYNPVKFTLAELESIKNQLEPYMVEYNIATLDANDVTNKIDIELYNYNENIEFLVSNFIDLEYVNISVLPEDFVFEETIATELPENKSLLSLQNVDERGVSTIYPGNLIMIGDDKYICTAGPRYSSNKFYTCGHASRNYINPIQTVYRKNTVGLTLTVGTTGNVVFDAQGDSCLVTVPGSYFDLPSTNSFPLGSGVYTYGSGTVGTLIEMHGGISGITQGQITAINQTVNINSNPIGNLSKANYTCQKGDSGAAIFSRNIVSTSGKCYGLQSIGANLNSNTNVYQTCYFHAF